MRSIVAVGGLLLCSCAPAPISPPLPGAVEPIFPTPARAPLPAPVAALPEPTLPPGTLYEADVAALHRGYLETLDRAAGKPLAKDAPLFAGNALQWRGNSYSVAGVSLLLLGKQSLIYENEFDPHAERLPSPRLATREEIGRGEGAEGAMIHVDRGTLLYTAPLPIDTALCTPCHAAGAARRAALVYRLRELADD